MTSYRELCEGLRELLGKQMEEFQQTVASPDIDKLRILVEMFKKLTEADPDLRGRVPAPGYEDGDIARARTEEEVEEEAEAALHESISVSGGGTDPFESRTKEIVEGMGE